MTKIFKRSTFKRTICLLLAITLIVVCISFLFGYTRYEIASWKVEFTQKLGNQYTWTLKGYISNWELNGYTERYTLALQAKNKLIQSSIVANWANALAIYHNKTWLKIKWIAPLIAVITIILCIWLIAKIVHVQQTTTITKFKSRPKSKRPKYKKRKYYRKIAR